MPANRKIFIKMKKSILSTTLILAVVLLAFGCKTRAKTVTPTSTTTPTKNLSAKEVVQQNDKSATEIKFLDISNAEARLQDGGKTIAVRSSIKIIAGKEISISVLPLLGIELFRVKITPERFYVFDKLNKKYCDGSYEYLSQMAGTEISYKDIEALLTNRLFSLKSGQSVDKAYNLQQQKDKFLLSSKDMFNGYRHSFELSPDYLLTATALDDGTHHVKLNYSEFGVVNKVLFPMLIDVKAKLPKNALDLSIVIKKVQFNKPIEISELDFSRYTKTDCKRMF